MPANFFRRVACIIKDADPIGLDLLATAFNDKSRPPPLEPRHVTSYMTRVAAGGKPVEVDPASVSIPASPVPSHYSRPASQATDDLGTGPPPGPPGTASVQSLAGPDSWDLMFGGQVRLFSGFWMIPYGVGEAKGSSAHQSQHPIDAQPLIHTPRTPPRPSRWTRTCSSLARALA